MAEITEIQTTMREYFRAMLYREGMKRTGEFIAGIEQGQPVPNGFPVDAWKFALAGRQELNAYFDRLTEFR